MMIEEAIKRYNINAEYERTHGNLQGCLEFRQLADWLKELKQLREQTRWIPCSERLPDECQKVLVQTEDMYYDSGNNKGIVVGWHIRDYWSTHTIKGCENIHYPVAWMPLPDRYEEVQNDT